MKLYLNYFSPECDHECGSHPECCCYLCQETWSWFKDECITKMTLNSFVTQVVWTFSSIGNVSTIITDKCIHDDWLTWKYFLHHCPFQLGIHWWIHLLSELSTVNHDYHQTSNIRDTFVGNIIVENSDVGAAPTASSSST